MNKQKEGNKTTYHPNVERKVLFQQVGVLGTGPSESGVAGLGPRMEWRALVTREDKKTQRVEV